MRQNLAYLASLMQNQGMHEDCLGSEGTILLQISGQEICVARSYGECHDTVV